MQEFVLTCLVCDLDIGSVLKQSSDHPNVTFSGCPHYGRLLVLINRKTKMHGVTVQ